MNRFFSLSLAVSGLVAALALGTAHAQAVDPAELLLRLDRLEGENRRLNGQVEQLQFQARRLEDQLRRFQSDVDFRFKESGGKGLPQSAPPAVAPPQAQTAPAQVGQTRRNDAFDPNASPAAPGAPRSIGQLAAEVAAAPPASNAAPGTAKGDFDFAKSFFDRGQFELAEGSFKDFLRVHPRDRLIPDALFFVGESYYRRNRFREAAENYLTVTTSHGKSARASEAMLKLGMSLRGLGAKDEACATYVEVTRKYPNAAAAIKQAVERERKRAQCPA